MPSSSDGVSALAHMIGGTPTTVTSGNCSEVRARLQLPCVLTADFL